MELNDEKYNKLSLPEKISFFDNIDSFINDIDLNNSQEKKALKNVLTQILNDKKEDNYIRKKSLETICDLTVSNHIRVSGTLDLLLDLDENDDSFILSSAIKYIFYFHETEETESIEMLKKLCFHSSGEVSSEAYFRLGQIYFFKSNEQEYILNLTKSNKLFYKSYQEVENRIDAELFYLTTEILINKNYTSAHIDRLANIIWELSQFDFNGKTNLLYIKIYECLISLNKLTKSNPNEFFENDFNTLCNYHYQIINLSIKNDLSNSFLDQFKNNITSQYIEPFYINSLKNELSRIKKLKSKASSDDENNFWQYLLTLLKDNSEKKKDSTDIKLLISRMLPNEPVEKLEAHLNKINLENVTEILNFITPYLGSKKKELITGSNAGDDIFNEISNKLDKIIGVDYSKKKLLEFKLVLEDVIKYIIRTTEIQKSDDNFSFLFNPDAIENDLQRSMINMLKLSSPRASSYSEENQEFTDGGRIDIKYQSNDIIIPLELKRTKHEISEERMKKDYLSQAQTYTYNHDQLGFFIVLDLTTKIKSKPMNDIRDLFGIIHLETQHRVNEIHPDHIVWCIVPANKITPSERSTYK